VGLKRPRRECGDEAAARLKCSVNTRWKMVTGARDRPEVAHIDFGDPEITFPADNIHWIKGIDHPCPTSLTFNADFPLWCLRLGRPQSGQFRRTQDSLVEKRMLPKRPSLRQCDCLRRLDHE